MASGGSWQWEYGGQMCTEGAKAILLKAGKSLDILGIEPDKF